MFWPVMAAYVALCLGARFLPDLFGGEPPAWAMGALAIATAAPIAAVFWVIGRFIRETDEYQRKMQIDAMMTGGGITLSLTVAWGFLEAYEVISVDSDLPAMLMVSPAFFLFYGLSYVVGQLRRGEKISDPMLCVGKDEG